MLIKKPRIPLAQIFLIGLLPSFIKVLIYRLKGFKIQKKVKIGIGSVIISNEVEIGEKTNIGFGTVIRANKIRIGRFVRIGSMTFIDTGSIEIDDDSKINEQVLIAGIKRPESGLTLGKRTTIMEYSYINPTMPIKIGDDSGIGGHCLLFTHGSWLNQLDGFPVKFAPIKIGKNVWLPWRVFIMPGVEIGDNVVIGANSLINQSFSSNLLIAGSPAKIIKENFPEKPDQKIRKKIMLSIINDFINHLEHEGLSVEKIETDKEYLLKIFRKNKLYQLHYILEFTQSLSEINIDRNSVLLFDFKPIDMPSKGMILDLYNKKRSRENELGEEFVKFLSRYGIRFDRKD